MGPSLRSAACWPAPPADGPALPTDPSPHRQGRYAPLRGRLRRPLTVGPLGARMTAGGAGHGLPRQSGGPPPLRLRCSGAGCGPLGLVLCAITARDLARRGPTASGPGRQPGSASPGHARRAATRRERRPEPQRGGAGAPVGGGRRSRPGLLTPIPPAPPARFGLSGFSGPGKGRRAKRALARSRGSWRDGPRGGATPAGELAGSAPWSGPGSTVAG